MNLVKSVLFVPAAVAAMAASVLAQTVEPGVPPKHYVTGIGGAAANIDFQEPTTTVAVEYGERMHRNVTAYANLAYIGNLMSDEMRQNLVTGGDALTAQTGVPWEFRGRDRGVAFSVGAKFLIPTRWSLRPYAGGGIGVLNLERTIKEHDLGEVSGEFYDLTGLNDGVIGAGETSTTGPLVEGVAGVQGAFGRTFLDVSYRFRRGFNDFGPIDFSQITIGVGVAWH